MTLAHIWRPETRKRLSELTFALFVFLFADVHNYDFETTHDLKASRQQARSPDLTPTQVWRPELLKQAGSGMKMLIFHVLSKRSAERRRKRKNQYVHNVWRPRTGPDRRAVTSGDPRKRSGRTYVMFGESASCATRVAKRAWDDLAAHT